MEVSEGMTALLVAVEESQKRAPPVKRAADGMCLQCGAPLPPLRGGGSGQQAAFCQVPTSGKGACRKLYHAASKVSRLKIAVRAEAVAEAASDTEAKIQAAREEGRLMCRPTAAATPATVTSTDSIGTRVHLRESEPVQMDVDTAAAYNALYLGQQPDRWDAQTFAFKVTFTGAASVVFKPLIAIAELPRSQKGGHQGYVLLSANPDKYWLNKEGRNAAGFEVTPPPTPPGPSCPIAHAQPNTPTHPHHPPPTPNPVTNHPQHTHTHPSTPPPNPHHYRDMALRSMIKYAGK